MEQGSILAVLWAIYLHHNELVFKGTDALTDGVIQEWKDLCLSGVEGCEGEMGRVLCDHSCTYNTYI